VYTTKKYTWLTIFTAIANKFGFKLKNNLGSGSAPTSSDDNTQGYSVGSMWSYGGNVYVATSVATGNAVWMAQLNIDGSNANSDIDIGNYGLNAKHLKVNGTGGAGHIGLKHQSAGISAGGSESSIGADNTGNPIWNDGNVQQNIMLKNSTITGATKTKITYDANGLVTSGADATTSDIADSTNKRYVTDANLTVIGNTSGTNTGDNATNSQYSGLATSKEDVTNKTNTVTGNETSTSLYLSVKGYYDYLIGMTWLTNSIFGTWLNGIAAKTTPVDADVTVISDSADSNKSKKLTFANLKAFLKTYFDTIYSSTQKVTYTDNTGYTPSSGSETVVFSVLIPANTFSKDKLLDFDMFLYKDSASVLSYSFAAYITTTNYAQGTTAGLPTASQRIISQSSGSIAQVTCHVRRSLYIHPTTGLITMNNQGASGSISFTDFGTVSSSCSTAMTFDTTVNNYVCITQQSTHLSKLPLLSIK
jgi:hypothetical protein